MNRIFAFVLLAFGFASAANALPTTWVDQADLGGGQHIGRWESYTYTHDLNDNGFTPLSDVIESFTLSINLADDSRYDSFEFAFIDLPGLLGDGLVYEFGAGTEFEGGFSILGRLQLNTLGLLDVTIQSVDLIGLGGGDFNLISSTLTARGESANVPEPGALGLLGIGLVGIALSRRRRKQVA